jgi:hypothetical protein
MELASMPPTQVGFCSHFIIMMNDSWMNEMRVERFKARSAQHM